MQEYPPPPVFVVEGPGDVAPMVAAIVSPSSVTSEKIAESPVCLAPPSAARPRPPPLRRQPASRFSWPPDADAEWCYINLPPAEMAIRCEEVLGRPTTALEVAQFFTSAVARESRAYAAYAVRYQTELHEIRDEAMRRR